MGRLIGVPCAVVFRFCQRLRRERPTRPADGRPRTTIRPDRRRKTMTRPIRVMIVLPENNTTIEPEIAALCPALAPLAVARVKRPPRTLLLEDLPAYAEATLDAIAPFTGQPWELAIYGCAGAGFLGGPDSNARMVERLRERTGAIVVSTAGAMVDVLHEDNVTETA